MKTNRPLLIVISGPSAVGKDVLIDLLKKYDSNYHFVVTTTTRKIRKGEKEGINHFFISVEKFNKRINDGKFLEWAKVYGNYYGVEKKQVEMALEEGKDVIIRVDVQGAERIRHIYKDSLQIFIHPPNINNLKQHLIIRGVNDSSDINLRLKKAKEEIDKAIDFKYSIINYENKLLETAEKVNEIIDKEHKFIKDIQS